MRRTFVRPPRSRERISNHREEQRRLHGHIQHDQHGHRERNRPCRAHRPDGVHQGVDDARARCHSEQIDGDNWVRSGQSVHERDEHVRHDVLQIVAVGATGPLHFGVGRLLQVRGVGGVLAMRLEDRVGNLDWLVERS